MTIRMTVRGAPPAILYRTFRCTDCGNEVEMRVESRDAPPPDCEHCAGAAAAMPSSPHIANAALNKAVDIAWDMMQDMGHTDMKSNVKPGDIVAMAPKPMGTSERESIQQQVAEFAGPEMANSLNPDLQLKIKDFWKPTGNQTAVVPTASGAPAIAGNPAPMPGQAEAKAMGVDALSVLEKANTAGRMRHDVAAASDMKL